MLGTERLNQLHIHRLVTVVGEDTQVCLALVQSLGTLVQSTGKTIVDERVLQDLLQGDINVHSTSANAGDIISTNNAVMSDYIKIFLIYCILVHFEAE